MSNLGFTHRGRKTGAPRLFVVLHRVDHEGFLISYKFVPHYSMKISYLVVDGMSSLLASIPSIFLT